MPKVLFVNDQSGNALSAAHFDDATDVVETTSASGAIELLAQQHFDAQYYDLIFAADWEPEFNFLEACFKKYVDTEVTRLLSLIHI